MKIAAIVARCSEDMELIVPVDVWRRAGFTVDLIAVGAKKITLLQNGTKVTADKTLAAVNLAQYNAIFLPGGKGHLEFKKNVRLLSQLRVFCNNPKKWVLAICAAPSVLGEMGLLEKRRATAYPGFAASFKKNYVDEPIVHDGNIVTAMGPAIALSFALKAVALLGGEQKAKEVGEEILFNRL